MEALKKEKSHTIEDIYALADGERMELVDGVLYRMAPPERRHQEIVGELYRQIANYISEKNGDCRPYVAPFVVFLNADDKNYVEPDISVICDPSKLDDAGCHSALDWVIEVVSPGSQRMDFAVKLFKYRTAGVKEYWIVDEKKDRIMAYDFVNGAMLEYTFSDSVRSGLYGQLSIDFRNI